MVSTALLFSLVVTLHPAKPSPGSRLVASVKSDTAFLSKQGKQGKRVASSVWSRTIRCQLRAKRCTPVGSFGGYGNRGGVAPPIERRTRSSTKPTSVR